jgi:hypothetical protein
MESLEGLARREPLKARDAYLDDEAPAGIEVRRGIAEARDLRCLRSQVHDRVPDQIDD